MALDWGEGAALETVVGDGGWAVEVKGAGWWMDTLVIVKGSHRIRRSRRGDRRHSSQSIVDIVDTMRYDFNQGVKQFVSLSRCLESKASV